MIIVDRIEEDIAVVYFGDEKVNVPISELPEGIHEGTVLKRTPDGLAPGPRGGGGAAADRSRIRFTGCSSRIMQGWAGIPPLFLRRYTVKFNKNPAAESLIVIKSTEFFRTSCRVEKKVV